MRCVSVCRQSKNGRESSVESFLLILSIECVRHSVEWLNMLLDCVQIWCRFLVSSIENRFTLRKFISNQRGKKANENEKDTSARQVPAMQQEKQEQKRQQDFQCQSQSKIKKRIIWKSFFFCLKHYFQFGSLS